MQRLKKLFGDFFGLVRVVGIGLALAWLGQVILRLPAILKRRDLQPADHAMGHGPFYVRMGGGKANFRVGGEQVFTGIREMYVRDTYLRGGKLRIADGDFVLDLGANIGNFTNLALAHGHDVRAVAVEPNRNLNAAFHESLCLNPGFTDRAMLVQAFVGASARERDNFSHQEAFAGAAFLSEADLIHLLGCERIDLLKCDIEGGEYELFRPGSVLLGMTRQLAVEIHSFAGDVQAFIAMLGGAGFTIKAIQRDPDGTCTVAAARVE